MTISSIHFQKADVEFAKKHNFRTEKKEPEYLLDTQYRKTNEYLDLHDPKKLYQEQLKIRFDPERDKPCRGYAPQIKDVYWEAVVNLDEKHSLADVRKVADHIQQKYHIQTCSIALHHDEGYKDKDGTVKYNHHAHICFLTMDNGISTMRKIRSKELRQMQSEVAQLLGMQRGQENSKATRLDHKQYREKAKELARIEQKQKQAEAVLEQVQPALQRSVEEKKQLNSTAKRLNNKVFTLKAQKAIIEAERKRWKEAHDFVADEYRKLQALNKTLYTKEQLESELQKLRDAHALRLKAVKATQKAKLKIQKARLKNALDDNTVLQNKLDTKPKEVIKTVEKIVEKSIQVEVPVETVKEIIVPRQLTASEIEELPRVKELNNSLKKQSEELECAQGRISYLEQAYNQTLDNYSVLQNDYNELVTDYRKLDTDYNNLKTEYNLLKRSKTNDECSRVRIDTENQSENILQAYARTIGYSKSEPKQADEFDSTEKPTQTTSFFRSKGFHR